MTHQDAYFASQLAAQEWAEDYPDLLTIFDGNTVNKALYGYFATTQTSDAAIGYDALCRAFIDLVDRKVLVPEFQSDITKEQFAEMRDKFAPNTAPVSIRATSDLEADAPRDYSTMTRNEFDRMATSDARILYKRNASFKKRADQFWRGGN